MRKVIAQILCIAIGVVMAAAGWALGAPFTLAVTAAALWIVTPFLPGRWRLAPPLVAPILLAVWRPGDDVAAWQVGALALVLLFAWAPFWIIQGEIPWRRIPLVTVFAVVPLMELVWFAPTLFDSDVAVRAQAIMLILLTVLALVASRAWAARTSHLPR